MLNDIILSSKISVSANNKIYIYDGENDCIHIWNATFHKWQPPIPIPENSKNKIANALTIILTQIETES